MVLTAGTLARADVLSEWNDAALAAVIKSKQLPFVQTRTMAILDVAMFDAVNAVDRQYVPYAFKAPPVREASAEAAAAAAARGVLRALFSSEEAEWERLYAVSLARVVDKRARDLGVGVGEQAAATILALRSNDGADAPNAYRPFSQPSRYVPTVLPLGSNWMKVKPWVIDSCDQFRPGPPPNVDSPVWRRDYDEVRAVGGRNSTVRTPQQTEVARFWIMTGSVSVWPVLRAVATAPGRTLVQNARFLATAAMAVADSYIAVFDAKYAYQFWRPITAIRNGGGFREPQPEEAVWEPLVDTPLHPEYPCAHCINSGAAAAVLEAELGKGEVTPIEITSATAPDVKHRWSTIRQYQEEVSNARVWGGIHYRNSLEVGTAMGRQIGAVAVGRLSRLVEQASQK
jgi:hypothetical protein